MKDGIATATYRIVFADNTGSRAADAIAVSVEGVWRDSAQKFDGEHDLTFIECPVENVRYLEKILDEDENVISYQAR